MDRAITIAKVSALAPVQCRLDLCNRGESDLFRAVRADIETHGTVQRAELCYVNSSILEQLIGSLARAKNTEIAERLPGQLL